MENGSKLSIIEALILASPEPLPARKIAGLVEGVTPSSAGRAVAQLNNRYMEAGCSFRLRELAGGFQFYIVPEFAGYVQELFARRRKMRLTRASLETLAIVAYRQPVTKSEIEQVRGVASDGVVHNLLQKKLITIRGRAKTVGKPLQYGTTDEFLTFFGLAGLSDLPKMSEIEELIAAEEPTAQTQLDLSRLSPEEAVSPKLNVADGTYDPSSDEVEDTAEDSEPAPPEPELNEIAEGTADEVDSEQSQSEGAMSGEELASGEVGPPENEATDKTKEDNPAGVIVDMDTAG